MPRAESPIRPPALMRGPSRNPSWNGVGAPFGPGDVEERGEPGPPAARHDGEALRHEGPVEAHQRNHVGHRGQRHEVERRQEVGRRAPVPEAGALQGPVQPHQHHEDRAGGAEVAQAGQVVLPVGVDEGAGAGKLGADLVVVDHHGVEAAPRRLFERRVAGRAAIDRDEQRRPALGEGRDGRHARAVAVDQPVRDVDGGIEAGGPQIAHQQRRCCRAVDVVVAQHGDPLARRDGARQPVHRGRHVDHHVGVGHEAAERGVDVGEAVGAVATAARQHARHEVRQAMALRDLLGAARPGLVEAGAPRAAQHGAADIEHEGVHGAGFTEQRRRIWRASGGKRASVLRRRAADREPVGLSSKRGPRQEPVTGLGLRNGRVSAAP